MQRSAVLGTIYGPAMWFAKVAILTMYLRLFNVVVWMRWSCHIAIWFLFCAYWSLVPVSVLYNFPHGDQHWDQSIVMTSTPGPIPFLVMGLVSVISDVFILVLPLPNRVDHPERIPSRYRTIERDPEGRREPAYSYRSSDREGA